jgi:non-homologous end joining protein Ku
VSFRQINKTTGNRESSQTIEIDSFVPRTQIDERFLDNAEISRWQARK